MSKHNDIAALAKTLKPDAALQQAMTNELARVGDACIYGVSDAWVRDELAKLDMLKHAHSGSELEVLLRDHTTKAVYIPQASALNVSLVSEILRRTAGNAPVFIERP